MIDDRFNELAMDNEDGDRFSVELDIVSVNADLDGGGDELPALIEMLQTSVGPTLDRRIAGIGHNLVLCNGLRLQRGASRTQQEPAGVAG